MRQRKRSRKPAAGIAIRPPRLLCTARPVRPDASARDEMREDDVIPPGPVTRPLAAPLVEGVRLRSQGPQLDERDVALSRRQFVEARLPLRSGDGIVTEDRTIPGPAGPIPVRLYRRAGAEGPLPILVYFHGGGMVLGNLDSHDLVCRRQAERVDILVMSVDYRLAPEHPYPAATEDAYAGLVHAARFGAEFGGDPTRIAVSGDSAGGMLTLATALMARDRGGPAIRALFPIYPMADLVDVGLWPSYERHGDGSTGLTTRDVAWFTAQYCPDPALRAEPTASPVRADLTSLPPAFIIVAEYDVLRDEGVAVAKKLAEAGVEVEFAQVTGVNHGFIGSDIGLAEVDAVFDRAMPWLMERLG